MKLLKNIKNYKYGVTIMFISSLFACTGQLLWKMSGGFSGNVGLLLLGFVVYGVGTVLMIFAYKFGPLSVLQPVLSLNYVLSLILGFFVLHEMIDIVKIFGVVAVALGVFFIAMGDLSQSNETKKTNNNNTEEANS